ncbi:MAG TPA: c-type cytochrome [Caldimonas sp.]|jgi:cytochrome c553|nr:c-type cytochrome [Caldimonas sp.]HEX2541739.1 c-type cytochrome [Caldimonas sp.]
MHETMHGSAARRWRAACAGAAAAIAAGVAAAQGATDLQVRSLAATCANCHGTDGRAVPGEAMTPLAGLPKDYLVTQMQAFRDGKRPATVMHQLAKGYSDAQIEALSAYFAARSRP